MPLSVDRPGPPTNKGVTFPAEILTPEEARALIRAASPHAPTGVRNRALMAVMLRAGLRLGEALALRPADVDAAAGEVHVLRGKGGRRRAVPIDEGAVAVLDRWTDARARLGLNRARLLFCTLSGGPLQPRYVRAMLRRCAAKAGIDKRVHPHGLRHTFAADLARAGVPMNAIQAALGHSSLQTTSFYLSRIAPGELADQIRTATRGWRL